MITVHHLNDSRSDRILWLLEELEMATLLGQTGDKPNLAAYVKRMHERPAYRRAIERGGPSMLAV